MPRSRETKKERRLAQSDRADVNDVRLCDFANAAMAHPSAHPRKCVYSAHVDSKKISNVSNLGKEDLSWFEKDIEDFVIDKESTEDVAEGDEPVIPPSTPKKSNRPNKTKCSENREKEGIDYPLDLWYQLSRHIYPESVSTFARLCKTTYSVVSTTSFWRNLYTRFYDPKAKLPKELHLVCRERVHGLHANVARALYHCYPPFIERLSQTVPFESEPHNLVGHRCVLLWYQPVKNYWNFCFKLVKPGFSQRDSSVGASKRDIVEQYDNISHNPESGCSILQVTCTNFLSVPVVMGMVLNKVFLTVSGQGMRYHTLRLVFDTRYQQQSYNGGMSLVLDPVVNIRVIPWWDPKYPFVP